MINEVTVPESFARIKRLPALPHDAHKLVKALSDDSMDYAKLAKVLEGHSTISSRLIALANSAWYNNSSDPVTSLERACLKLGLNVVRGVGIGLAVMKPFNVRACPQFDIKRYWVSTMLAALGAAALSEYLTDTQSDQHFSQTVHTGGILHNIGLLCMADIAPDDTHKALLTKLTNPHAHLNIALRQALGTDYCEVGAHLIAIWGIPEPLVSVIQYHRDDHYRGPHWRQAAVVGGSVNMVGCLFESRDDCHQDSLEELGVDLESQLEVFNLLREQFPKTQELAKILFH